MKEPTDLNEVRRLRVARSASYKNPFVAQGERNDAQMRQLWAHHCAATGETMSFEAWLALY